MRWSLMVSLFPLVLNSVALGASPAKRTTPVKPDEVVFALDWTPNTNHTGLFVAKVRKYFERENMQVKFIQPTQTTTTTLVASGKVQFGVSFSSDIIRAKSESLPVVSIAAIIQEDTSCFAWRTSSGIKGIKDWEGKRYGGWGSPEEAEKIKFIMRKNGADFSKLRMVTSGIADFLPTTNKNADFMWIYYGWDAIRAKIENVKIETLFLRDLDPAFDVHSPLIIASENLLKKNPDLVKRFLKAASDGYRLAIQDSPAAAKDLLQAVPELDARLVTESAKWLAPEYAKGTKRWGEQKAVVWSRYAAWLKQRGIISNLPATDKIFTNDFLPVN